MKKNIFKEKQVVEFLRHSNAIEGVYSDGALEDAKDAWGFLAGQEELTVNIVLQTHKILMKNRPLPEDQIGFFRRIPVYIGGREAVNSIKIVELIDSWLLDVKTSIQVPGKDGNNIKLDHIEYERIHPFTDGNGRTGRMFLNWQRVKAGLPILIIHEGEEQMEYYKWFKNE